MKLLGVNAALLDQGSQHFDCVGILALGSHVFLHIACESEGQLLPWHLVHDALGVVVPKATAELVIVHLRLVLLLAPQTSDLIGLEDAELVLVSSPVNHLAVSGRKEKVQQELPQLNHSSTNRDCRRGNSTCTVMVSQTSEYMSSWHSVCQNLCCNTTQFECSIYVRTYMYVRICMYIYVADPGIYSMYIG